MGGGKGPGLFDGTQGSEIGITQHGAQRMSERDALAQDAKRIMGNAEATRTQHDGARVYIERTVSGRFNVVVHNPITNEVITVFRTIRQGALNRLARNYGWR